MWLALQRRLWTSDRRLRHGLQDATSVCFLYDQEEDSVNHIMLQCVYSRQVWFQCFRWAKIDMRMMPFATDVLQEWWPTAWKRIPKGHRKGFDSLVLLICWSIWKQRNGRGFGGQGISNEEELSTKIYQELRLWLVAGARAATVASGRS